MIHIISKYEVDATHRSLIDVINVYEEKSCAASNVCFHETEDWWMVTTRDVKQGEELFYHYGANYWLVRQKQAIPRSLVNQQPGYYIEVRPYAGFDDWADGRDCTDHYAGRVVNPKLFREFDWSSFKARAVLIDHKQVLLGVVFEKNKANYHAQHIKSKVLVFDLWKHRPCFMDVNTVQTLILRLDNAKNLLLACQGH